jgi:hypothetical protein
MVWRSRPPPASDVAQSQRTIDGMLSLMPLELIGKEAASLHEDDPIEAQLFEADTLHHGPRGVEEPGLELGLLSHPESIYQCSPSCLTFETFHQAHALWSLGLLPCG